MTDQQQFPWTEANRRYLMTALADVRRALESYANPESEQPTGNSAQTLAQIAEDMDPPPALSTLTKMFDLSAFERDLLLLCAGIELDGTIGALCAAAHSDSGKPFPTFSLALEAIPAAHWSALSPSRPLRQWRLIEITPSDSLTQGRMRIDERILHFLTGLQHLDERLVGFVESVQDVNEIAPSHHELAAQLSEIWMMTPNGNRLPVIQINGDDLAAQRAVASAACTSLNVKLHLAPAHNIPQDAREREALMRLWEREAILNSGALLLDCGEINTSDNAMERAITGFIEGMQAPLIVAGRERRTTPHRPMVTLEVTKPTNDEQRAIWVDALGEAGDSFDEEVDALVSQFNLNIPTIRTISTEVLGRMAVLGENGSKPDTNGLLWDTTRDQVRPRMGGLAQSIKPVAIWDELVLPGSQRLILEEISIHVRSRRKVYETWGFAKKSSRGLGISALFAGPSGTGKTMAAEVLANDLNLDLYRIDLSSVVSKYIGETEKNLRRVFDTAEEGGAILLFDEADALFGKRSDVKDSHDRYANIEVSYLLQKMEEYRGLAVLTTNMKSALDNAFLRRIRFVVQFPFPNSENRAEIWRRIFPKETPTKNLDANKLARLNITGGNIRNIALYGAFLAAEKNKPVQMEHLLRAARVEYAKLEKPLTAAEINGWI